MLELIFPSPEKCLFCSSNVDHDILPVCPSCAEGLTFLEKEKAILREEKTGKKLAELWEKGIKEVQVFGGYLVALEVLRLRMKVRSIKPAENRKKDELLAEKTAEVLGMQFREQVPPVLSVGWKWDPELEIKLPEEEKLIFLFA